MVILDWTSPLMLFYYACIYSIYTYSAAVHVYSMRHALAHGIPGTPHTIHTSTQCKRLIGQNFLRSRTVPPITCTIQRHSPEYVVKSCVWSVIPLSHLPAISRRPLCALDLYNFHQSAVKSPQNVKSMTPGSFIVDQSTLLARSHRDYMRSQCDSSTLSTRSY